MFTKEQSHGFTIVELLIVIIVISILAALTLTAFNGVQKRSAIAVVQTNLSDAAKAMKLAQAETGDYPTELPSDFKVSSNVELSVKGNGVDVYSGLSSSQKGLLFFNTCQTLLDQGLGAKPDDNHDYISACTVYSASSIHIEGWNGRDVATPLSVTSLQNYVNSYSGGNAADFKTHAQNFMDQLASQYQAAGGTFPVTSFWDSWATPTNGGVVEPTLPAPSSTSGGDPTVFCVNATYTKYSDLHWHISESGGPVEGSCP